MILTYINEGILCKTMLFLQVLSLIPFLRTETQKNVVVIQDDDKYSGRLINNLAFKKKDGCILITVYLTQNCNPKSINLMQSSTGEEDTFTIKESIEEDVEWENDKQRFTYYCDTDTVKNGEYYSIQITDASGQVSHSEPFVYESNNFVFDRNSSKGNSKAGWIVAIVLSSVALLLVIILIFVRFCTN